MPLEKSAIIRLVSVEGNAALGDALKPIQFVDLESGQLCEEAVYGGAWVRWLYGTWLGRLIAPIAASAWVSRFYGWLQDRPSSRGKVAPFVERFEIELDDFLPDEAGTEDFPYPTFNQFFTRRLQTDARPFVEGALMPAPCEARYFAYAHVDERVEMPVKGKYLKADELLKRDEWAQKLEGGPGYIARLCPVDYHRFHFPDDARVLATWRVGGALHSVNPWALASRPSIFVDNERQVTILETRHFGLLAYIEVGATCVGKIVQTYQGEQVTRADEKGYFLFGGSTVVVLGEPGAWLPKVEILTHTEQGIESYLRLGQAVGEVV